MSILDNGPINVVPPATRAANQLLNMTVRTYQQMVDSFNRGSIMFWQNPQGLTPDEIAEALGTNAQEVFALHYQLGQLIGSVKPEAISEGVSLIGEFNYNEDGSVTIIHSEPTPEVPLEPTPEITPEPTPEITPEPTPEITPEPTPEITPEPTPEINS